MNRTLHQSLMKKGYRLVHKVHLAYPIHPSFVIDEVGRRASQYTRDFLQGRLDGIEIVTGNRSPDALHPRDRKDANHFILFYTLKPKP